MFPWVRTDFFFVPTFCKVKSCLYSHSILVWTINHTVVLALRIKGGKKSRMTPHLEYVKFLILKFSSLTIVK